MPSDDSKVKASVYGDTDNKKDMCVDTYYTYNITVNGTTVTYSVTPQAGGDALFSGTKTLSSALQLGGIYWKAYKSRMDDITIKYTANYETFQDTKYFAKVFATDLTNVNVFNSVKSSDTQTSINGFTDSGSFKRSQIAGDNKFDTNVTGLKFGTGMYFVIYDGYGMRFAPGANQTESSVYVNNPKNTQVMVVKYKEGQSTAATTWAETDFSYSYETMGSRAEANVIKFPVNNVRYITNIGVYEPIATATVKATIGEAGYATFSAPCALNFSETGLTAYTATVSGEKVVLAEVTNVQEGTGVILKGEAKTYTIPAASTSETPKGDLTATLWRTVPATGSNYVLSKEGDTMGFYKLPDNGAVQAGRAYLTVSSSARTFYGFDFETTGIESVRNSQFTNQNDVYSLSGQRINNPAKGLYIVNGKKVVIK